MPGRVDRSAELLKCAKFVIAVENTVTSGYITEKVPIALLAGAIPICRLDRLAKRLWKPSCVIDVGTSTTVEKAAEIALQGMRTHLARATPPPSNVIREDVLEWFTSPPLATTRSKFLAWLKSLT